MTVRPRYTSRARQDIAEIYDYSLRAFGARRTAAYFLQIEIDIGNAINIPSLGRLRPEFGEGVFAVRTGRHVAYLKFADSNECIVIAILHDRMNASARLRREKPG